MIRSLKRRTTPMVNRLENTADIGSHVYDATLIEEVISKSLQKIKLSSVLILVNKVIWKVILGKEFLQRMKRWSKQSVERKKDRERGNQENG